MPRRTAYHLDAAEEKLEQFRASQKSSDTPDTFPVEDARLTMDRDTVDFNWQYLIDAKLVGVKKEVAASDDFDDNPSVTEVGAKITAAGIDYLRRALAEDR